MSAAIKVILIINNIAHIFLITMRVHKIGPLIILLIYSCPSAHAVINSPSGFIDEYCAILKLHSLEMNIRTGKISAYTAIGAKEARDLSSGKNGNAILIGLNQDLALERKLIEAYTNKFKEIGVTINKYGTPSKGRGGITVTITTNYIGSTYNDSNDYGVTQELTILEHATTDNGKSVWSELLNIMAGDHTTKRSLENTIYNQADQIASEFSKLRLQAMTRCK